jgi:hypothetical protein
VYTQTVDWLWRNTREPHPNTTCFGTNINRNWPFQWGLGNPEFDYGYTDDPCDPTYNFRGFSAGDTLEVTSLVSFTDEVKRVNSNTIELRPTLRNPEEGGFVLLPEYILPSGMEMWEGVKYVLNII